MLIRAPHTTTIALTLLMLLATSLSGCASWFASDFQDPHVHLVKVDVIKARLHEQRFSLRFRIYNPNDTALVIRGLIYDIQLNGVPLANGESSRSIEVPAHGRSDYEVAVRTNLWRHLKKLVKSLENPEQAIRYQLRGEVKAGSWLFGRNVHLQRNGEIIPSDYIPE